MEASSFHQGRIEICKDVLIGVGRIIPHASYMPAFISYIYRLRGSRGPKIHYCDWSVVHTYTIKYLECLILQTVAVGTLKNGDYYYVLMT